MKLRLRCAHGQEKRSFARGRLRCLEHQVCYTTEKSIDWNHWN